jgi:outer membrane immunogenic protein
VVNAAGTDGDWRDKTGWTVGGGVEYAIDPHWSVRAEYRYDDYGSYSQNLVNTTAMVYDARHRETMQRVEAGFSYKFNTTAPTAFLASAK